ncbi:MAG: diguanylate cyclase [Actinomycetota bacterium]|nr:diguanylate cyclase [Actinomycetota bacterium]
MGTVAMGDPALESDSIEEVLRTALDLCLGLGSFAVDMAGVVHRVLSDEMPPVDGWHRVEVLARNCLSHPAAHGRDLFWNAEVSTEAGAADASLACVVVPVWMGSAELGLLGVVDTWLPEPDEYQRAQLARLATGLAPLLRGATGQTAEAAAASRASDTYPRAERARPAAAPDNDRVSTRIDAAQLIAGLDDGIMYLDEAGIVVLSNRAADAMHGLAPERTLVGSPLPAASRLRSEDGQLLANDLHPATLALRDGVPREVRLTVGEEGEGQRHVTISARPFLVEGERGVLVVLRDTTAEWMEQQRLTHYALYDPLTGLANRYLLLEELRRMLQGLGRRGGAVALIYMDLDDFKLINDEHGHDMGDEVLSAFARRLRGAVRSDDVVARLGGDEFVIAHATAERPPDGDLVVSRLRKVLSAPFTVRGIVFDLGASIGWVSTDRGDDGPDALLARADRAMYRHKRDRAAARRRTV